MLDLDAIKARLAAATPGPWSDESDWPNVYTLAQELRGKTVARCYRGAQTKENKTGSSPDTQLIAHAPDDLAALMAEVERLRWAIKTHQKEWGKSWNSDCEVTARLWRVLDA